MAFTFWSCLLVFSADAAPWNEAAKKELKALQGEWTVERIETEGKKHEPPADEPLTLTIKGRKWSFQSPKQEGEIAALDPSCNLIDLKRIKAGREDHIQEGIYKRNGDTLTLVMYHGKDKKRPTSFDSPTEAGTILWVLKRAKP